jgi:hypothetical protein
MIDTERHECHDCGVLEGAFHVPGCDMERCPFCGHQLISCGCSSRHFYPEAINLREWLCMDKETRPPFCGLPEQVYKKGLSRKQKVEWEKVLAAKGYVPWIRYPNLCCRCGGLWPEMFRVTDEEWAKYIEPIQRHKMICEECWEWIKETVDGAGT